MVAELQVIKEIKKEYIIEQVKAINDAAELTLGAIHDRSPKNGLKFIFDAKFDKIGYNPLKPEVKDNLIEQINQSLTMLTTYWILDQYRGQYFRAHLGEKNGIDLEIFKSNKEDSPEHIFEIFAATDPYRNKKLLKDIKTVVARTNCNKRSVCFCSPMPFRTSVKKYNGIQIDWENKIIPPQLPKEMEEYTCAVQKKEIGIRWIRNETLLSWAVNLIKAAEEIQ